MPVNLKVMLEGMFKVKASDLHLKTNHVPMLRVNTKVTPVKHPELTAEDVRQVLREIMPSRLNETFETQGSADFAYEIEGLGRFRTAAFRQKGTVSIVMRRINPEPPTFEELQLPKPVEKIPGYSRGLVLVTGITGSGKSSTLAAIIDKINATKRTHIITVEDPIEFLYKDKYSLVNQMEVGSDVPTFGAAMRRILRFDPDTILIGEMRDRETVQTALEAVDTGHLVFSTLHTSDAKLTINRILHFFEQREEEMILDMLAINLNAIISQRLLAKSGGGLIPACEILFNTPIIKKLIREGRIEEIEQVLKNGDGGMQTFDMCLANLVRAELITLDTAIPQATDENALRRLIRGESSAGDRAGLI